MEPGGLLPCSQEPATRARWIQTTPQNPSPEDPFKYHPPIYALVFRMIFCLLAFQTKFCSHFASLPCALHSPPISSSSIWAQLCSLLRPRDASKVDQSSLSESQYSGLKQHGISGWSLIHRWPGQHGTSGGPLSAAMSGSCKCYNPSVLALQLTHLGTLVIGKFTRSWGFHFLRRPHQSTERFDSKLPDAENPTVR
jgi:hypothetical protein